MKGSDCDVKKCQIHLAYTVKTGKMVICEVLVNLLILHLIINGMSPRHETDCCQNYLILRKEMVQSVVSLWLYLR